MMWRISIFLASAMGAHAAVVAADSERGARLFDSLACVQCHSVNGKGARVGPDLGRLVARNFTPAALAATMWNHAPAMWTSMRERTVQARDLDEQAAADLFAYFYSARFFEKPGDAARGKRVFTERACAQCHGLTDAIAPGIKPVSQWEALSDPVALTEAMWIHAPTMWAELKLKQIPWPQLSGQDLTDLLVYLRNLPSTHAKPPAFGTTTGSTGEAIFKTKGCQGCHAAYSVLADRIRGQTLTEIAAEMWTHGPRMKGPPARFEPGEMRELLSYLWARQFFIDSGSEGSGRHIFRAKHCTACHNDPLSGAPKLTGSGHSYTGATMVSALWHHGPKMLDMMKGKGIQWPRFDASEMSDLIAYLNSGDQKK
jgi:cytochrome c551/c552